MSWAWHLTRVILIQWRHWYIWACFQSMPAFQNVLIIISIKCSSPCIRGPTPAFFFPGDSVAGMCHPLHTDVRFTSLTPIIWEGLLAQRCWRSGWLALEWGQTPPCFRWDLPATCFYLWDREAGNSFNKICTNWFLGGSTRDCHG